MIRTLHVGAMLHDSAMFVFVERGNKGTGDMRQRRQQVRATRACALARKEATACHAMLSCHVMRCYLLRAVYTHKKRHVRVW